MVKVSVLVPVFNNDVYIGRCLRSLLAQTLESHEYEIIVVNDGSTDRTAYALSLFDDKNDTIVKCFHHSENLGLPTALNTALGHAVGEYVVRVDSDDYVSRRFLDYMLTFLFYNKHFDAVSCDYLEVDANGDPKGRKNCSEDPIGCGILMPRSSVMAVGAYDPEFLCHEDKEFRVRFDIDHKVGRLELPLYRYRKHPGTITDDSEKLRFYYDKILAKYPNPRN